MERKCQASTRNKKFSGFGLAVFGGIFWLVFWLDDFGVLFFFFFVKVNPCLHRLTETENHETFLFCPQCLNSQPDFDTQFQLYLHLSLSKNMFIFCGQSANLYNMIGLHILPSTKTHKSHSYCQNCRETRLHFYKSQDLKIYCLLKKIRFWFLLSFHHLEWEEVAGDMDSFLFFVFKHCYTTLDVKPH